MALEATLPLIAPGCAQDRPEAGLFQIWRGGGGAGEEGFVGNGLQIGALGCKLPRSLPKLSMGYPGLGDLL